MRASVEDVHLSGAERLTGEEHIDVILPDLLWRAFSHHRTPDEISITVESIPLETVSYLKSLDVTTVLSSSCKDSIDFSRAILKSRGISPAVIEKAIDLLCNGPTPEGTNMRGAIIMDALTGERLEPDIRRGIRVSRMDYTEDAKKTLVTALKDCGIYHGRVVDALAVATKVASRKETIAELCWSDDPDYTTGYVASKKTGYVRITKMKEKGSCHGGRVFFIKAQEMDIARYIDYLQRQPVIIDRIGSVSKGKDLCSMNWILN